MFQIAHRPGTPSPEKSGNGSNPRTPHHVTTGAKSREVGRSQWVDATPAQSPSAGVYDSNSLNGLDTNRTLLCLGSD